MNNPYGLILNKINWYSYLRFYPPFFFVFFSKPPKSAIPDKPFDLILQLPAFFHSVPMVFVKSIIFCPILPAYLVWIKLGGPFEFFVALSNRHKYMCS